MAGVCVRFARAAPRSGGGVAAVGRPCRVCVCVCVCVCVELRMSTLHCVLVYLLLGYRFAEGIIGVWDAECAVIGIEAAY